MPKSFFIYIIVFSIPLALGLTAWQSTRYAALKREIDRNNRLQLELIEQNKRLITEIASLSAPSRIGQFARDIGLDKQLPESVLHVSIHE